MNKNNNNSENNNSDDRNLDDREEINNFFNNISEEMKVQMNLLKYYEGTGKAIGSLYLGMKDLIGEELAIGFTETFISSYVYNLFNMGK